MAIEYPSADNIHDLHEAIVVEHDETEPGIRNAAGIESALTLISEGYFGQVPDSVHEKAAVLMKELAAGHYYVDGNKRTALSSTAVFYALNGMYFDYGAEIMDILEQFAIDADTVMMGTVVSHFERCAIPEEEADPEMKRELALLRSSTR